MERNKASYEDGTGIVKFSPIIRGDSCYNRKTHESRGKITKVCEVIFLFINSMGMHLFFPLRDSIGMALIEDDQQVLYLSNNEWCSKTNNDCLWTVGFN